MSRSPSERAATELLEIDAARRAVDAADRTARPALLLATAALTFVDHAVKDHVPRRTQKVVTAVVQTTLVALTVAVSRSSPVVPYEPAAGPAPRRAALLFGSIAAWMTTERVAVALLRRRRLRHPHRAAGALLALTRPAGIVVVTRLLPRAGRDV
ncbi:hypothetical protein [Pseudonocardia sp. ICBG1293]|uniref:hypothetical protein n=1 Tax=Pseudonocardia sp. ICBG1293 TaxID=2844382 RepID=UPI001CCCCE15|nr:hypothetical protein [Pseudonocardia sp. ICBG1293]